MKLKIGQHRVWDDNHIAWIWDENTGELYVEGTLEDDPTSGYQYVESLNKAFQILEEDGYLNVDE